MDYIGHPLQIRGAEKVILQDGKADGMHFVIVRNGLGLECWISLDRCADLMRVTYEGKNMGYLSACGNVSPTYYEKDENGFLKSFTAGFFTTAGFNNVGGPLQDEGENLPMHGTISNIPSKLNAIIEDENGITIKVTVEDSEIFARKFVLKREYFISYEKNTITLKDCVENQGDKKEPFMVLYHCNMGYPLVNENSVVIIPNNGVKPRNEHASKYLDTALKMEKPQAGYEECCFYYDVKEKGNLAKVGIYNPDINSGVVYTYDKKELPCFTQWKMMGKRDYVLGLEPGNCNPEGRKVLRENGTLQYIEPDGYKKIELTFSFVNDDETFYNVLNN